MQQTALLLSATPIYAGILGLIYIYLSFRVVDRRRSLQLALGDGGDTEMLRRQRVHGNFAEYVPLVLILILMCELQGAPVLLVHALGLAFTIGRISHAYGVSQRKENLIFRMSGMILTFATLAISAVTGIVLTVA
ncbi:MAPEG family protein [Pannonibacter phragmitetus]|uniref:MAPEG family protein n=1 Tax=Pannonibacter phragmitetus TaxID=121719 RepID=UPI003D2F4C07